MTIKGIAIGLLLMSAIAGAAQPGRERIIQNNMASLDSVADRLRYICDSIRYPSGYHSAALKADRTIIAFLNTYFQSDITVETLHSAEKQLHVQRISEQSIAGGLLSFTTLIIQGHYLEARLKFAQVDGVILHKTVAISTQNSGVWCSSGFRALDLQLLKQHFLKDIGFPIRVIDASFLSAKDLLPASIATVAKQHSEYRFDIPPAGKEDESLRRLFINQYIEDSSCLYRLGLPDSWMVGLIRQGRTDLIRQFLWSPNYYYAVDAMEALEYLTVIGKVTPDEAMQARFAFLKQADTPIRVQHYPATDVVGTANGYKQLTVTEAELRDKYQKERVIK
jgi:hypothetical protein